MKYIYTIFVRNYKKNIFKPFAIAKTKDQGKRRVKRLNYRPDIEGDFFQLVRISIENGGYFNEGKIIEIKE